MEEKEFSPGLTDPASDVQDPPILTMTALGRLGRFGNQIFQYAFLKICARASNAQVQTEPWVGQALFGHKDPPVSVSVEPLVETGSTMESMLGIVPEFMPYLEKATGRKPGQIGVEAMTEGVRSGDVIGLFQWHSSAYRPHKEYFRSLFQPCDDLRPWLDEPITEMRKRGKTIVALHLRTGDYHWLPQMSWTLMPPLKWWAEWLASIWNDLDEPVLYLCSNNVDAVRPWFKEFESFTSDDFPTRPPARLKGMGVGFYRDYYVMTQADVLAASNSTFSFTAAMLNERAKMFVRPHWDFRTRFTEFDPWNSDPLLFLSGDHVMLKGYRKMLHVARATRGIRGALASVFLYHPGGTAIILGYRVQLAYKGRGWRGLRDLFLGRNRQAPRKASQTLRPPLGTRRGSA